MVKWSPRDNPCKCCTENLRTTIHFYLRAYWYLSLLLAEVSMPKLARAALRLLPANWLSRKKLFGYPLPRR